MGRLAAREWQALWEDLARDDDAKAYAAMDRMSAGGPTVIAAMKERLHPVRPADSERLGRLFTDLDSDEFAVRRVRAGSQSLLRPFTEHVLSSENRRLLPRPCHRLRRVVLGVDRQ